MCAGKGKKDIMLNTTLKKIFIAPSLLAANPLCWEKEVSRAGRAEVDFLHCDIMDGAFVPNISFGPEFVKAVREVTRIPIDVHLMLMRPLGYIQAFYRAGATMITFHVEALDDVDETIDAIHAFGLKAGLSLCPETPYEAVVPYLHKLENLLVMTVRPGFGGQTFMPEQLDKLRALREIIDREDYPTYLQVDGGIQQNTAPLVIQAGADSLVAGSFLFCKGDMATRVRQLRAAALGEAYGTIREEQE